MTRAASMPGYAGHRPGLHSETDAVGKSFVKSTKTPRATTPRGPRGTVLDNTLEQVRTTAKGAAYGAVAAAGYSGHVPGGKTIVGCTRSVGNKQAVQAFGAAPDRANRQSTHPLHDGSATTRSQAVPGYTGCIPNKQDTACGAGWERSKKQAGNLTRRTQDTTRTGDAPREVVVEATPASPAARERNSQRSSARTPRSESALNSALQSINTRSSKSDTLPRGSSLTTLRTVESDSTTRSQRRGAKTPPPQVADCLRQNLERPGNYHHDSPTDAFSTVSTKKDAFQVGSPVDLEGTWKA